MKDNKKSECGAILFHSTTKSNLKNIMKVGMTYPRPVTGKVADKLNEMDNLFMKNMRKEAILIRSIRLYQTRK